LDLGDPEASKRPRNPDCTTVQLSCSPRAKAWSVSFSTPTSVRRHALLVELLDRRLVLRQMRQSHAAQDVGCFGELDVLITDNLDPVAPWVEEVKKRAGQGFDSRFSQRFADRILVVDHQSEMAPVVCRLGMTFLKRQELIAQIDKGGSSAFAPQFKVDQSTIEGQSLADVTDFERYVVETNRTRFFCIIRGTFLGSPDEKRCGTD